MNEKPLKPEQKPDKGGPKYTLDVQDVHATLDVILKFVTKKKEQ